MFNLVINARVAAEHGPPTSENLEEYKNSIAAEMDRPEELGDPSVATDAVTRKALEDALHMSALSTLKNWGLELHQSSVDPVSVLKVLGDRYGYWTDDVEHDGIIDER